MILDTDVTSLLMLGNQSIIRHIKRAEQTSGSPTLISAIAVWEMARGIEEAGSVKRKAFLKIQLMKALSRIGVAPFTGDDAMIAAEIFSSLRANTIGEGDSMIAAQSISRGVDIATLNVDHFSRVSGIRIAQWCLDENNSKKTATGEDS